MATIVETLAKIDQGKMNNLLLIVTSFNDDTPESLLIQTANEFAILYSPVVTDVVNETNNSRYGSVNIVYMYEKIAKELLTPKELLLTTMNLGSFITFMVSVVEQFEDGIDDED